MTKAKQIFLEVTLRDRDARCYTVGVNAGEAPGAVVLGAQGIELVPGKCAGYGAGVYIQPGGFIELRFPPLVEWGSKTVRYSNTDGQLIEQVLQERADLR